MSFLKLLKEGLNLDLSIAIDFTGSNGDPIYENSLHYISNGFINNYEKAMRESIKIISMYNKGNKYNVYGFGAQFMENSKMFLILMELMMKIL